MSVGGLYLGSRQQPSFSFLQEEAEAKLNIPRLPLFSRCPITNQARLEDPRDLMENKLQRIPFNSISNVSFLGDPGSRSLNSSWSQVSQDQESAARLKSTRDRLSVHKPSLDEVRDNSLVALTNKFGKGKYWFKSACPTPDPRWSAEQQLMIGPIPGDVEYAQLRSAFLAQGHTLHLFIQNNQGWLEKNQEKFGAKHVKFGYVVYTERETAMRLLIAGYVPVGTVKIRVKEMDGKPALFMST
jgi:hypothetical protein